VKHFNYKRPAGSLAIVAEIDASATLPDSSTVWHYSVVLQQVRIGEHVNIGSRCEIGRASTIGDYSRIGSGVFLPPNSTIGARVFVGPNVTFTDDKLPRVPRPGDAPYFAQPPIVDDDAVIGAGAVILPGVRIGKGARVAAGAIVTKDVPDNGMVRSQPARPRTMPVAWQHVERES
jgi:UDP-2-acetamido-3-amino-2,3-dideoxy-glucuronate N-acetyltransferase